MAMKRMVVFVIMLVVLMACGVAAADNIKVAMVTDVGGLGDQSFNDAAYRGLKQAEAELGATIGVVESNMMSDYEPNLSSLAESGFDLVWAVGFLMTDALNNVAQMYPDTMFGIIDSVVSQPNVMSVTFKEQEGSFLAGAFAGMWTKTGKVGYIGGMEVPLIQRFEAGFRAGVKAVNPGAEVLVGYAGSFNDPGKGKELALAQYNQGADIIYHASGATGLGLIEAAKETGKYAIGVDSDQTVLAPKHVVASMLKRVEVGVFKGAQDLANGQFKPEHIVLGLAEDGVDLAYSKGVEIPAEIKEKIKELKRQIINGEIKVPASPAEL